jgi:hypothetical protein
MTASPIEARSLSSLTNLFANPPQYPRNPTHQVLDPLVLYILRVPGSRGTNSDQSYSVTSESNHSRQSDVFLTPLKPSTKSSISAEAINASLYYLHVATREDEVVKESLEQDRKSWEAEQSAPVPIARKPLPLTPFTNYPASQRPPLPPKAYPHLQPPGPGNVPTTQVARQAARAQHIRFNSATDGYSSIPRKPIGPRPLHSSSQSVDTGLAQPQPVGRDAEYDELLAALGQDERRSFDTVSDGARMDMEQGLHITLIRRDPSSSAQWNIGRLSCERGGGPGLHHNAFKIDITAPGYQKFAKQAGLVSFYEPTSRATPDPSTPSSSGSPSTPSQTTPFTREVVLTQPRSIILPRSSHDRHGSKDVTPYDNLEPSVNAKASMRNHHFAFASPWQGTCIFMTGMNGRSLKCRHTLPTSLSGEEGETRTVAELRFNLPWSVLRSKDTNRNMAGRRNFVGGGHAKSSSLSNIVGTDWKRGMQMIKEKRRMRDPGNIRRGYDSEPTSADRSSPATIRSSADSGSESDQDGRLDLRLGREKAGGGRKGKSAKLGKLIIEDEGLKMCDLVVAAAMGVWWQHYATTDEALK